MRHKLFTITEKGTYSCIYCNKEQQYYQDGDTINLYVTTSTMANAHQYLYDESKICTHDIEIFELNRQKFPVIMKCMTNVIKEMVLHNNVL